MNENQSKVPQWHSGYQETRNLIHNEMGITKESMQDIFREIAREEIRSILGQNGEFIRASMRNVMREEMIKAVNEGKYPHVDSSTHYFDRNNPNYFQKFISGVMKEELLDLMRSQFDVGLQITPKPTSGQSGE